MLNVIARDAASQEFFDAAADGILLTRRCRDCTGWSDPAALRCAHCHSAELEWAPTAGTGTIASWVGIPPSRKAPEGTPSSYVAIVELDEGPWVTMAVPGTVPPKTGMPVSVSFSQPEGGEFVPVAVAVNGSPAGEDLS